MSLTDINIEAPDHRRSVALPESGQVVRVRTRTWLVESVEPNPGYGTLIRLACLDDDAQGQPLEVIWELELDSEILDSEAWQSIGRRGFDNARHFSAYLHTLRWNRVTATDPRLFQAPFRAASDSTPTNSNRSARRSCSRE